MSESPRATSVGVIGGGQLARMMLEAGLALGVEVKVLAEEQGMASRLAASQIGDYHDFETVARFAAGVDVVTFDHEHVPQGVLTALEERSILVRPGSRALRFAQDKLSTRRRLSELGVLVPEWVRADSESDVQAFLNAHDGVAVAKTAMGGYDGKGVKIITEPSDVADWFRTDREVLLEEKVAFRRELAQLIARRPNGEVASWPLVETTQLNGICVEVIAPAPDCDVSLADAATQIATRIANELDVVGVMAVELFETFDGRLLVNELAMRPHNSGHWTQDGSVTSQFEQHIRAVLDLPLGDTSMIAPWAVMANVLGGMAGEPMQLGYHESMRLFPAVKIHSYGKESKPGRKIGHVNVFGGDLEELRIQARAAASMLSR